MTPISINVFHILVGIAFVVIARRAGPSVKLDSRYVMGLGVVLIVAHGFIAFKKWRKSLTKTKTVTFEDKPPSQGKRTMRSRFRYKN